MRSNRFTAIYLASVQHQIKKRFQDCGAVFNIHQPNRPSIQFPSFSFLYWTSSPSTRRDNALALDGDNSSRFQTVPAPALFLLASNTWRHHVFSIFIMSPILYTFGRRAPCVALDLLVRRRPRRGGGERECDDIQSVAVKSWRKFLWRITTSAFILLLLLSLVSSASKLGTRKISKISRIALASRLSFAQQNRSLMITGMYSIQFEPVHLLSAISLIHRQIVSDSALSVNTQHRAQPRPYGVCGSWSNRAPL